MEDFNRIVFIGRCVAAPEVKYTPQGKQVASFTVACQRYGENAGADFIRCVAWEKTADIAGRYLDKGKQVLLSGRLGSRQWEKDGEKRTSWEVTVRELQLLNGRHAAASDAPEGGFVDKVKREFDAEEIEQGDLPF